MQLFRRRHYQQFALWLAIAAVLLRALIPDGFMPEHRAGQRGLTLAFCIAGPLAGLRALEASPASEQVRQQLADGGERGTPDRHPGMAHPGCAFASATGPGLLPAHITLPALPYSAAGLGGAVAAFAAGAVSYLRPPARAPPRYS